MKNLFVVIAISVGFGSIAVSFVCGSEKESKPSSVEKKNGFYSCPMHPQVKVDQPGECPICHMKLQRVFASETGQSAPKPKERVIKYYRNPMNPSITSKVPTKDNMGMDYIPVYENSDSESQSLVPGRATVRLDQNQFRLTGAHLIEVKRSDARTLIPASGRVLSQNQIALQVPERDLRNLATGLSVDLSSPATGEEVLHGKISSLNPMVDPMTRTLRVNVQLEKSHSALRAEGSAQGYVYKNFNQALTLPQSAILELKGIHYVFVADEKNGTFTPKKISVIDDNIEISGVRSVVVQDGIAEGDQVSSGPNFLLDSESRIQVSHDQ